MKKIIFLSILFISITVAAQNKVDKLIYGKASIAIPENCTAETVTKINDCDGFSAMWFYIESAGGSMRKKTLKQIEEGIKYTDRHEIKFYSQNQLFEGMVYHLEEGTYRYVGFGKIEDASIMIVLGFNNEVKSNSDLNDFQKNFITF